MKKIFTIIILTFLLQNCSTSNESSDTAFKVPKTEDIIMYEINIGSYSNDGNLNGITARLDEIEALGINTIWLMPIYPIGTINSFGSPYCVKDYRTVNAEFGSIGDLKNLVHEAHNRDIAIILDWVGNHTSWDNAWITIHPDWYTHNSSGNIISPAGTNWTDVADLNFNSSNMREEMISAMQYWIDEAGVDGYRCDAADLIPYEFWNQAITSLKNNSKKNIIMLAEGSRADHFTAGFQMNFGWDWYNALKNVFTSNGIPENLYTTNINEYTSVPAGDRKLRFTTNHDLSNENTPPVVFGSKKAALAASVTTIYLNGTPLIYCGQEVGISESTTYTTGQPINWNINPDILFAYKSVLQFYKNSNVARTGTLTYFENADIIVFQKAIGNKKILVLVNSRTSMKTLSIPVTLQGNWKNALTNQNVKISSDLTINGYEYLILTTP